MLYRETSDQCHAPNEAAGQRRFPFQNGQAPVDQTNNVTRGNMHLVEGRGEGTRLSNFSNLDLLHRRNSSVYTRREDLRLELGLPEPQQEQAGPHRADSTPPGWMTAESSREFSHTFSHFHLTGRSEKTRLIDVIESALALIDDSDLLFFDDEEDLCDERQDPRAPVATTGKREFSMRGRASQ
mmetsp:Transcript_112038/g.167721  ORF Transcript_112038/g.167721 Transcript_112038/m.167721 type:complete len:183 (+) Transcript_112038:109-657(+)